MRLYGLKERLKGIRKGRVSCRNEKPEDPLSEYESMRYMVYDTDYGQVSIPYDSEGHVPMWALAQRFQQVGNFDADVGRGGVPVRYGPFTPDDIVDWWIDPSVCDIAGLDDEESSIYDVSSLPKEQQVVQRRIAVIAPKEEADRIRNVLASSFTLSEIEKMSRHGSFVIHTIPDGGDATGCYWRKQDGVEIPVIALESGCTADGVVHEMVHHLRAVDDSREGILRTPYPMDEEGKLDAEYVRCLSPEELDSILEMEERLTVAETDVRTKLDPSQSGYYDGVRGKKPRDAYREDRHILTDTPPDVPDQAIPRLRGKQARQAIVRNYAYSNIAESQILSRNVRKR